ncbi:uncharacterized protein LOC114364556 [Ostrinia furnacalis]|uniref:uncharacterized protein LOC114364556 n=1 Tax=Ostrinia furnacalis TaxID=93504 RepID=UPI00103A5768|nr:uncharacterized protein LOC114364556 [Ostrinia furnacalis]
MAQNLWIAVLAVLVVAVNSHVIKSHKMDLSNGMTVEVIIRPSEKADTPKPEELGSRVFRRTHDVVVPPVTPTPKTDVNVDIVNRFGIRSGTCPTGYVQRGGFCFPDYD